jgi:hypothetical protein
MSALADKSSRTFVWSAQCATKRSRHTIRESDRTQKGRRDRRIRLRQPIPPSIGNSPAGRGKSSLERQQLPCRPSIAQTESSRAATAGCRVGCNPNTACRPRHTRNGARRPTGVWDDVVLAGKVGGCHSCSLTVSREPLPPGARDPAETACHRRRDDRVTWPASSHCCLAGRSMARNRACIAEYPSAVQAFQEEQSLRANGTRAAATGLGNHA